MAGTTRLELATSAVTGQRSNQLNYVPNLFSSGSGKPLNFLFFSSVHRVARLNRFHPLCRIPGFYRQETVRKCIPTRPDASLDDPEHLSMPQVSIVTEGGLMHQCLSPRRISKRNCRSERLGPTSPTATSAAERSRNTPMSKLHGTEVRRSHHHRSVINVIAISQQPLT
jgi:hypothetical protein